MIYYVFFERVDEIIHTSDSEMEDLAEEPVSKKSRRAAREKKRSKAWLKEDEDIVDFLDPSAARSVVGKVFLSMFQFSYVFATSLLCIIKLMSNFRPV